MREDLKQAVALVVNGYSFGCAALALGLRRNQVAGACRRAGIRAKRTRVRLPTQRPQVREYWRRYREHRSPSVDCRREKANAPDVSQGVREL